MAIEDLFSDSEKKVKKITQWSVVGDNSPYTAPECRQYCLRGDTARDDGSIRTVETSYIVNAKSVFGVHYVETRNTIYVLTGDADPNWVRWMDENNISFDPSNPIKIRG